MTLRPPFTVVGRLLSVACLFGALSHGQSAAEAHERCFERVHRSGQADDADYRFDLAFDRNADGDSFACDIEVRASDARKVLDDFRFGVLYDSGPHIARSVSFPLRVSVSRTREVNEIGERITIKDVSEWRQFVKARMSTLHLALIACANVRNVMIVKSRTYGFAIGAGMIWFVPNTRPRELKVRTVNLRPMTPELLVQDCAK